MKALTPITHIFALFQKLQDTYISGLDGALMAGAVQEINDLLAMGWNRTVQEHISLYGLPEDVKWTLMQGHKIRAIKMMREQFSFNMHAFQATLGLKAAKDLVDEHGAQHSRLSEILREKGMRLVQDPDLQVVPLDYMEMYDRPRHELNDMARNMNLNGYEFMNREEIIQAIRNAS